MEFAFLRQSELEIVDNVNLCDSIGLAADFARMDISTGLREGMSMESNSPQADLEILPKSSAAGQLKAVPTMGKLFDLNLIAMIQLTGEFEMGCLNDSAADLKIWPFILDPNPHHSSPFKEVALLADQEDRFAIPLAVDGLPIR